MVDCCKDMQTSVTHYGYEIPATSLKADNHAMIVI